jgi:hypothetical protein
MFDIVVTAEDDTTTKTYSIVVHRISNDATLSSMSINAGTLNPAFNSDTTNYKVIVANDITDVTIEAVVNYDSATVSGTGYKPLNVGDNLFDIIVTAEDDTTTKTYSIVVHRISNDATLSSMSINAGTLNPAFNSDTTNYKVIVGNNITDVTIEAVANHDSATVSGTGYKPLNVGDNMFDIVVTAEDDTTTKIYIVMVTRKSNVGITDPDVSKITVYPNPTRDNITVILPENISSAIFTLYDMQGKALLQQEINNQEMVSVSNLAAGVYIYNVTTEKQNYTGKIVINN